MTSVTQTIVWGINLAIISSSTVGLNVEDEDKELLLN